MPNHTFMYPKVTPYVAGSATGQSPQAGGGQQAQQTGQSGRR